MATNPQGAPLTTGSRAGEQGRERTCGLRPMIYRTPNDTYTYLRRDGRVTRVSHDLLLERKARYRQRRGGQLADKQRRYRERISQEKSMIKHGRVHQLFGGREAHKHAHLETIKHVVTKGIADSKEPILIQPLACDVKGAKRFNSQQCVIAKALTRVHKPQAVAVGRSYAYVVFNGLAIRFMVPIASRKLIEEFDQHGRVRKAPIELRAIVPSLRLGKKAQAPDTRQREQKNEKKRAYVRKYGVRAIGGGVTA